MHTHIYSSSLSVCRYLPPETFENTGKVRVSSKVDVWSAGVILYQMLYGKRPFGDGMTQQRILHEKTILRDAHSIEFPAQPVVTDQCKVYVSLSWMKCWLTHTSMCPFVSVPLYCVCVCLYVAQDFIRRCLTYHHYDRPDVAEISTDPYLLPGGGAKTKPAAKRGGAAAAAAAAAAASTSASTSAAPITSAGGVA